MPILVGPLGLAPSGIGALWGWSPLGLAAAGVGARWVWHPLGLAPAGVGAYWGWPAGIGLKSFSVLFTPALTPQLHVLV